MGADDRERKHIYEKGYPHMNGFVLYVLSWNLCMLAAFVLLSKKKHLKDHVTAYGRFLLQPWKAVTFMIAASGVTLAAPYSGDVTWDYVDGVFM